jgi:hypothetical protein
MRPDGQPIWTSEVVAGHDHDLTAARDAHLLGARRRHRRSYQYAAASGWSGRLG